jgi:hypothetical protein
LLLCRPMNLQTIETAIKNIYIPWLKSHEKLVVIALASLLAWHFYGAGLQAWIDHDKRLQSTADAQNQTVQAQLIALSKQVADTNARIDAAMAQRASQTQQAKKQDDSLAPAELASRIQAQLGVGTVKYETTDAPLLNQLVFDDAASHKVADDEEDLLQLKGDVQDLNTKLVACNQLSTEKDQALTTEKQAHVADVNLEKAKSKKSFWRGFKLGAITGFIGGLLIHK